MTIARRALIAALLISALAGAPHPSSAKPTSAVRLRSTFYADVRTKQFQAAVVAGRAYRSIAPNDEQFALDYAYALLAAHETADAVALLTTLRSSPHANVRAAAVRQLDAQRPAAPPTALAAAPQPFAHAYALLAAGSLPAARGAFLAELAQSPNTPTAWRQVSYIDHDLHDSTGAVKALDRYLALEPNDDHAKLQRAYELTDSGDAHAAHDAFVQLQHAPDAEVATAARRQLAVGAGSAPTRLDVFGYAEDESRFHDGFFGVDARYRLAATRVEPYVVFHLTDDSRSSAAPAAQILNDDVAILAVGLRTRVARGTYAFAEGGTAHTLLNGHDQTDLRYGLLSSARVGIGGAKPQTQFDGSLVHYSRYINTIAYGTLAHDFALGSPTSALRGVVGVNGVLDTSREYYNNAVEGFAGVQVRAHGVTLRLVAVGGTYLGRGIGAPLGRTYTSLRPELLFGFSR